MVEITKMALKTGLDIEAYTASRQTFGERFLCYLVGGIDELQVTRAALKPQ